MKLLKNKAFIGVLCLVIAALVGFVLIPALNSSTRDTIVVAKLTQTVPKDTLITADMVTTIEIGSYGIPDGAITNPNSVVGMYSKTEIMASDILYASKLAAEPSKSDAYLYSLEPDHYAIAVTAKSLAATIGGCIQAGDIVTIYNVVQRGGGEITVEQPNELKYVRLLSVLNSAGLETTHEEAIGTTPSTVIVSATVEQVRKLAELELSGNIYFVHIGRGNDAEQLYANYNPATYGMPDYEDYGYVEGDEGGIVFEPPTDEGGVVFEPPTEDSDVIIYDPNMTEPPITADPNLPTYDNTEPNQP